MQSPLPPVSAWSSALVAAVIGFGGTIALVVQAMQVLGATVAQTGAAVTALCLGIAVGGALLSFRMRIPVVLAWSTPGAALLAATQTIRERDLKRILAWSTVASLGTLTLLIGLPGEGAVSSRRLDGHHATRRAGGKFRPVHVLDGGAR